MTRDELYHAVGWDQALWGSALAELLRALAGSVPTSAHALELGAGDGGLSLCAVQTFGCRTLCSDRENPKHKVLAHHPHLLGNPLLTFAALNGLSLDLPDKSQDLVLFKSMLGALSSWEHQGKCMQEIWRVLKPGGRLCFLENARASQVHQWARRRWRRWGTTWRYVSLHEMHALLSIFRTYDLKATGYLTAFAPTERLKRLVWAAERPCMWAIPRRSRYLLYGLAVK